MGIGGSGGYTFKASSADFTGFLQMCSVAY